MYTIGQISKMFDLPVSTLRYYDKEGLFPNMARTSGIRKFSVIPQELSDMLIAEGKKIDQSENKKK